MTLASSNSTRASEPQRPLFEHKPILVYRCDRREDALRITHLLEQGFVPEDKINIALTDRNAPAPPDDRPVANAASIGMGYGTLMGGLLGIAAIPTFDNVGATFIAFFLFLLGGAAWGGLMLAIQKRFTLQRDNTEQFGVFVDANYYDRAEALVGGAA